MFRKLIFLCLLVLTAFRNISMAQEQIYKIDSVKHEYSNLRFYLSYYNSDSIGEEIDQVIKIPDSYFQPYSPHSVSSFRQFWLKFTVKNNTDNELPLWLLIGQVDYFKYYSPQDTLKPIAGGNLVPLKDLSAGEISRYAVPLSLKPGQIKSCYLYLKEGWTGPPRLYMQIVDRGRLARITSRETVNFWQGIFHGILWVMIIYNIFFTVIGKDNTYLFYALYMICISVYFLNIMGYLQDFLFPNNPGVGNYLTLIMQLGVVFYLTFLRKFLNLKSLLPVWDRISIYLIYATLILLVIKTGYFLIFQKFGIFIYVSQLEIILGAGLTIGLIFALYRSKSILARYFMIGSICLGLGLLLSSLMSFSRVAFSPAYFSNIQLGIGFEILFFSLGLSYKISENEKEKNRVQQQLIGQLQENERLQANYARELEARVEERTLEISAQKTALENQTRQLEELNEEKNHLIGIVAHDLRNPLTGARSMINFLRENPDAGKEEINETIPIVSNALDRMNSMIDKILDIRAIESQTLNVTLEIIEIQKFIEDIIVDFESKAEAKSLHIHKYLDPVKVYSDRHYLTEIMENLISNAIKFSPDNKNIWIKALKNDGQVILSVTDEGPGFTEDDKKRLFLKYQRLSARPTHGESSTGLGLSIVKKFMEALKGEVVVESEKDRGCTFKLLFKDQN